MAKLYYSEQKLIPLNQSSVISRRVFQACICRWLDRSTTPGCSIGNTAEQLICRCVAFALVGISFLSLIKTPICLLMLLLTVAKWYVKPTLLSRVTLTFSKLSSSNNCLLLMSCCIIRSKALKNGARCATTEWGRDSDATCPA